MAHIKNPKILKTHFHQSNPTIFQLSFKMYSFQTLLGASATILAILSPTTARLTRKNVQSATACCEEIEDCYTLSGKTDDGLNWCAGSWTGTTNWTQGDADTAKCLTNLHYVQNDKCITKSGSSCDNGDSSPDVAKAYDTFLYGNYQLSSNDSRAIQAAMDAMVGKQIDLDVDAGSDGYIVFSHVADNGSGINGIEVYNSGGC
jgi:hypothetical protein